MESASEKQRIEFSQRLAVELRRAGLPVESPTQIARLFSQSYSGDAVTPQTVRKWLHAEAMPTQPRLLALASMLGVPAQWLRYGDEKGGKVERTAADELMHVLGRQYPGLLKHEGLLSALEGLSKLSARDFKVVAGLIRDLQSEHSQK